jgi:hypothetical protein
VSDRGGALIAADGTVTDAAFAVVPCRGIGALAPVARLEPAMAVLLWLEHVASPRSGAVANELLGRLAELRRPLLAIKQGAVAGPADRPGCTEIGAELVTAVLDGLATVEWERDPDFGYEVPAAVPGLDEPNGRVLEPRLLYADHDRVYEHAGLVADKKRERRALADSIAGLDPTVAAASGWPPEPTGRDWRD